MRSFTLLATALLSALLVSAHPGHGNSDLVERKVLNATTGLVGVSNDTADADDHVPLFKTNCDCPPAICDTRMNAKSICACKQQALLACYMKSAGGCPKPADNTCN